MAEVTAIVNARPLTTISYDPESPCLLTPSLLLTQKSSPATFPIPDFGRKDMLRSQWKHVQVLAEEFWQKWRSEYLHSLQPRKKWKSDTQNLTVGQRLRKKRLAHWDREACVPWWWWTGEKGGAESCAQWKNNHVHTSHNRTSSSLGITIILMFSLCPFLLMFIWMLSDA